MKMLGARTALTGAVVFAMAMTALEDGGWWWVVLAATVWAITGLRLPLLGRLTLSRSHRYVIAENRRVLRNNRRLARERRKARRIQRRLRRNRQ